MTKARASGRGKRKARPKPRPYESPLREEQAQQTQQRILMTAAELLKTREPVELTIAGVAEAAGVSSRTVYRHYPNVPELLRGVARLLQQDVAAPAQTLDDVMAHIERQGPLLDEDWRWALVETKVPALDVAGGRDMFLEVLASRSAHLDEHGKRMLAGLVSMLCSPHSIVVLSGLWDLRASTAIRALRPVIEKLIELSVERPELFRAPDEEHGDEDRGDDER